MSLEGQLRDLGLAELLQLLAVNRKSGTLHLQSTLHNRGAAVHVLHGSLVHARSWPDLGLATPAHQASDREIATETAVVAVALELLRWRDGTFSFTPAGEPEGPAGPVRLSVESVLLQAAQSAEQWARLADRVPHARVVPTFSDIEPQQLPLLRLSPAQWEVLTRVDGQRDLVALADALQHDLLDVAERVHGLIGVGLLMLRVGSSAPRRNATPPAMVAVDSPVPIVPAAGNDDDSLLDPVQWGVSSPRSMPLGHTLPLPVASEGAEPSVQRELEGGVSLPDGALACRLGDEAARQGNFEAALRHWSTALQQPETMADTARLQRVQEAIVLTTRLQALLHP